MNSRGNASSSTTSENRIKALRAKHALLSNRVEEEQKRLSTTDFYLKQLKKQKLLLKEEIESIRRKRANAS